jgi:hypothetical protein
MPNSERILTLGDTDVTLPKTEVGRWFFAGGDLTTGHAHDDTHPWYQTLWLTGVDYFSTLGYQPGIALLAAGALSPVATAILVLITLFGVLPVYSEVSKRSYAGQGSIALLENLLPGWWSKVFVLFLLGFASTDFVITMTLSAADAAHHLAENAYLHPFVGDYQEIITIGLLLLLSLVFMRGFREAMHLAMGVAVPYLLLNAVVLIVSLKQIFTHPEYLAQWSGELTRVGDWTSVLVASAFIFPKLALGMSGFETGVSVMPLVKDDSSGKSSEGSDIPTGRIRATQKLLLTAAIIMSVLLLFSSFVTSVLISEADYQVGGPASGRAIAFLAHRELGSIFGTVYDLSTILILWFAGASALAGLLNLIPRYLPRFGMAPRWTSYRRPLVTVLFLINLAVTIAFHADVEAQGGAYATGVLVLMLSAAFAVTFAHWKESKGFKKGGMRAFPKTVYFALVTVALLYTLLDNVIARPDGVLIAAIFIIFILTVGGLSRQMRATELRISELTLRNDTSSKLWDQIVDKKVHLVPLISSTAEARARKRAEVRRHYNVEGPLAFVHVRLRDNRSEFFSHLHAKLTSEGDDYVLEVYGATAIANSIAFISELIDPISIFIGLTGKNLMTQAFKYLLFGEGETGLMIYTILLRYWESTPEEDVRPLIFLMSQ